MGLQEQPPARAAKPAPAPAPPPPAAPAPTGMSDDQTKTANCIANTQHEKNRGVRSTAQAAATANDMAKTMAIADAVRRLRSTMYE